MLYFPVKRKLYHIKKYRSHPSKKCCGCCGCGCCGCGHWCSPGGGGSPCNHCCGGFECCQPCCGCCGGGGCGCCGGCGCHGLNFPVTFGACTENPCCACCSKKPPKGKCQWPCMWPCCCTCTPPKFQFSPLKAKPMCKCPHKGKCCGGCCSKQHVERHEETGSKRCGYQYGPYGYGAGYGFNPVIPYGAPALGWGLYGAPYGALYQPPPFLY